MCSMISRLTTHRRSCTRGMAEPPCRPVYLTISNSASLFDPQARPDPDARTDSVVALNLFTGRQIWWEQTTR